MASRASNPGLVVTGTIGIDTITTPEGTAKNVLGGSATYFSAASSVFVKTSVVSIAGDDLTREGKRFFFKNKALDVRSLEIVKGGRTFRWSGKYHDDFKERETLITELNVLEHFKPRLDSAHHKVPFVFLANTDPGSQLSVLSQMKKPKIVGMDTMNLWIAYHLKALRKLLKKVDLLVLNDSESQELSGERLLKKAAAAILKMGPKTVIIKKGQYGSSLYTRKTVFHCPSEEVDRLVDPTGAGDSYAGGMMGYLAASKRLDLDTIHRSMLVGSVCASLAVSDFAIRGMKGMTRANVLKRAEMLRKSITCKPVRL